MSPTDHPTDDQADDAGTPAPKNKGGRPGLTPDKIRDAFEQFVSREGRAPSQTELRRELGDKGSFTTIARARTELIGQRLIAGTDTPETGSPEAVLLKAVTAAMTVLAGEAGTAADALVTAAEHQAEKRADERVAAADARIACSDTAVATANLERERALGRADALQTEIDDQRRAHRATERDLVKAHERESKLRDEVGALRSEIAERREALQYSETVVTTLEQRLRDAEATIEAERTGRAAEVATHREAIAAAAARDTDHAAALARVEAQHAAAVVRADEASERSERLERSVEALAAARTEDVIRGHVRVEQLMAALNEAGVSVPAAVDPDDDASS